MHLEYFYLALAKQGTSFEEYGQNGESETTLPMMINVGDNNTADVISWARSFSSAKTYIIAKAGKPSAPTKGKHFEKFTMVCKGTSLKKLLQVEA